MTVPIEETRNSQLFETAWQKASDNINALTTDNEDRRFLKSLVMGGTVAAEAVVTNCQGVKEYWGAGNEVSAREISQLFSSMMLSQCYRWLDGQSTSEGLSRTPKEFSATRLIYIFGSEPEQALDEFLNFDTQFNYDLDHKPHMIHLSSLLLAKSCEICGHKCIDWERVKFPVKELIHIVQKGIVVDGAPIRSQQDIDEMKRSLNLGIQAMLQYHDGDTA